MLNFWLSRMTVKNQHGGDSTEFPQPRHQFGDPFADDALRAKPFAFADSIKSFEDFEIFKNRARQRQGWLVKRGPQYLNKQ